MQGHTNTTQMRIPQHKQKRRLQDGATDVVADSWALRRRLLEAVMSQLHTAG